MNQDVLEIFDDEEYHIPTDITEWAPTNLRSAHSYWASNYVYCLSQVSKFEATLSRMKRKRKRSFNTAFLEYRIKQRMALKMAEIRAENNKLIVGMDDTISDTEQKLYVWKSLLESCRTYRDLCSRDQSYREKEMQNYMEKGGQGR